MPQTKARLTVVLLGPRTTVGEVLDSGSHSTSNLFHGGTWTPGGPRPSPRGKPVSANTEPGASRQHIRVCLCTCRPPWAHARLWRWEHLARGLSPQHLQALGSALWAAGGGGQQSSRTFHLTQPERGTCCTATSRLPVCPPALLSPAASVPSPRRAQLPCPLLPARCPWQSVCRPPLRSCDTPVCTGRLEHVPVHVCTWDLTICGSSCILIDTGLQVLQNPQGKTRRFPSSGCEGCEGAPWALAALSPPGSCVGCFLLWARPGSRPGLFLLPCAPPRDFSASPRTQLLWRLLREAFPGRPPSPAPALPLLPHSQLCLGAISGLPVTVITASVPPSGPQEQ